MEVNDPTQLKRMRNREYPGIPCEVYLLSILAKHATFDEAAAYLGVTRPTLIRWRRIYGMEVGKTTEAPEGA